MQTGFHVPELTEALVGASASQTSWKGAHTRGESCNSLMGPTCFYTANPGGAMCGYLGEKLPNPCMQ